MRNEAETRADLIDPAITSAGWGEVDKSRVGREYQVTPGRIRGKGMRERAGIADYVLVYRDHTRAVVEAKAEDKAVTEGLAQAKRYAAKLHARFAYSTNGHGIYRADLTTGTGKTAIAFQIVWKLYHSRWTVAEWRDTGGSTPRHPRVLFLADRNILANQAFNAFAAFPEDALVRIDPGEIPKKGRVPKNGSVFFTIFQTFMTGSDGEGNPQPYFGAYPPDFFDLVIIDECHRGGANDESTWRGILEYFAPAVQIGLTATPKRSGNVDTSRIC